MALSPGAWTLTIAMAASAANPDMQPMHVLFGGHARTLIVWSVAGALQRLESLPCRNLLTDFADGQGRSLADNLDATGLSLPDYVSRLYFVDGDRERGCANALTSAFTAPGSHAIHVCPTHFGTAPGGIVYGQMIVIHEILHTLGLGENPPSTTQITRRVIDRCRVFS